MEMAADVTVHGKAVLAGHPMTDIRRGGRPMTDIRRADRMIVDTGRDGRAIVSNMVVGTIVNSDRKVDVAWLTT